MGIIPATTCICGAPTPASLWASFCNVVMWLWKTPAASSGVDCGEAGDLPALPKMQNQLGPRLFPASVQKRPQEERTPGSCHSPGQEPAPSALDLRTVAPAEAARPTIDFLKSHSRDEGRKASGRWRLPLLLRRLAWARLSPKAHGQAGIRSLQAQRGLEGRLWHFPGVRASA